MRTEEQTINIIFDAGKGTSPVRSRESTVGAPLGTLPIPSRAGFAFDGWYLDEAFTIPAGDIIDASVAEDTVLYAKWIQVMDVVDLTVTINHAQVGFAGGLATNYNKVLYTQLTYAEALA